MQKENFQENKREQNQEKEKADKKEVKEQDKISFVWIILGIGAILLIWLLSSWIYK